MLFRSMSELPNRVEATAVVGGAGMVEGSIVLDVVDSVASDSIDKAVRGTSRGGDTGSIDFFSS